MNPEIKLQPLRISHGWKVTYNTFYEVDPVKGMEDYFDGSSLLMLIHHQLRKTIDVEWRPEMDLNGNYHIYVYNFIEDFNPKKLEYEAKPNWENPYLEYSSKLRLAIVSKLEELMLTLPQTPDDRILERRGVISEPSESFRLDLLENGISENLISKILHEGNSKIQTLLLDHKEMNRTILQLFLKKGRNKKVKNKAHQKLMSKSFRV